MAGNKLPTQKTPKAEEIPIPTRGEFMHDLKKMIEFGPDGPVGAAQADDGYEEGRSWRFHNSA